jgi:hypothetical protein
MDGEEDKKCVCTDECECKCSKCGHDCCDQKEVSDDADTDTEEEAA